MALTTQSATQQVALQSPAFKQASCPAGTCPQGQASQVVDSYNAAGAATAQKISGGEDVGGLLEKTASKVDGLASKMRSCPFGKAMPKVGD